MRLGKEKMKIRVSYLAEEKEKKQIHEEFVKRTFQGAKVKETAPKDGYLHTILTIPKPRKTTK